MKILEVRQARRHGNLQRLILETAVCLKPQGFVTDVLLLYNRNRARLLGEDAATLPDVHPLIGEAERSGIAAWQVEDDWALSARPLRALLRLARDGRIDLLHTHDMKTDLLGLLSVS